jgi:hypothetical protein
MRRHGRPEHWYVPVTASFDGGESNALLDVVIRAIAGRAAGA